MAQRSRELRPIPFVFWTAANPAIAKANPPNNETAASRCTKRVTASNVVIGRAWSTWPLGPNVEREIAFGHVRVNR